MQKYWKNIFRLKGINAYNNVTIPAFTLKMFLTSQYGHITFVWVHVYDQNDKTLSVWLYMYNQDDQTISVWVYVYNQDDHTVSVWVYVYNQNDQIIYVWTYL